jgi:hypothetical protein
MEKIYKNASCDAKRVMNGFKYLLLICFLFVTGNVWGQSTANYAFSTGASSLNVMTGATSLVTGNNDDWGSIVLPIGFNFVYMGNVFSHISVNSNGQARLHTSSGASAIGGSAVSSYTSSTVTLAPMAGDNEVGNGMSFLVTGSAPNRKLIIEWNNFYAHWTDPASSGNMQLVLNETTGVFEYIYGNILNSSSSTTSRSIFHSSGSTANASAFVTVATTPTVNTSATSPTTNSFAASIAIANLANRMFTFTPNVASVAGPTNLTFASVTATGMTLNWTAASPTTGIVRYVVQRSTDGGVTFPVNTNVALGTNTLALTGLTPGTNYTFRVVAVSEGVESTGITGSQATPAGATYFWVGATGGLWNTFSNWNTAADGTGATPTAWATTDVHIIDGAGTTAGGNLSISVDRTSFTLGQFRVTSNTNLTLASSATTIRTLTISGGPADDFMIENGSTLNLTNATNHIAFAFSGTGNTGDISGTYNAGGSTNNTITTTGGTGTLVTVSATGVVNNAIAGSSGCLTGSAATLSFANGSNYNHSGFTTACFIPTSTWGASSNVTMSGSSTSAPTITGAVQSFGNLTFNLPTLTGTFSVFTTSTVTIQGNLNVSVPTGIIFRATTSGTLTVNGNLNINSGTFQHASSSGIVNVLGNTTINSGTTLDLSATSGTFSQRGATFTNNGTIIGSSGTTGAALNFFSPTNAPLAFAGSGTVSSPLISLGGQTTGGITISHTNQIPVLRVNLFTAPITNSNKLTIGTGAALACAVQVGSAGNTLPGGSFDQSPTWNLGTGTISIFYSQTSTAYTSGFEVPPTRTVTNATITNTSGLTIAGGNLDVLTTLTMTAGIINTSTGNILGLAGTGTLSGSPSATNMVNGPFNRTFAASRTASGTYTNVTVLPVGKGGLYTPIFIDPTTTAGGSVTFTGEAFTSNSGTLGSGITSLGAARYEAIPITGAANLTNVFVRISNASILSTSKMLQSTNSAGTYEALPLATIFTAGVLSTAAAIPVASYTGFLGFGEAVPCTTPSDQASNFIASNKTTTSFTANFDPASSNPTGYLVVRYTGTFTPTAPVDGTLYASGSALGGTVVGNYYTAPFTFNQTSLAANTVYTYKIYSFNNTGCAGPAYNATSYDETITTCGTAYSAPTSISASNITTTSMDINYTASTSAGVQDHFMDVALNSTFTNFVSGYQNIALGIPVNAGAQVFSLSGLNASTTYFVRIKAVDGAGCESSYSTTLTQASDCNAITTLPHTELFTTYLPSICWNEGLSGNIINGPSTISSTASKWSADGFLNNGSLGAARINIFSTAQINWLISPSFTIPASGYRLKYSVGATQFGATTAPTTAWETDDSVCVMISTSGYSGWSILKTFKSSNLPSHLGQTERIDLSAYSGQNIRIAFMGVEGAADGSSDIDFFVDSFIVEQTPAPTITAVTSSNACGGNTKIVIIGSEMNDISSATIGSQSLLPFDSTSSTRLLKTIATPLNGTTSITNNIATATNATNITFTNAPALSVDSNNFTICNGSSATVNVTSTLADYTSYSWSPASGVSGTTSAIFNPTATTTYTLSATNSGTGCSNMLTRTVTVDALPTTITLSQGRTTAKCFSDLDSLEVSGGVLPITSLNSYTLVPSSSTYTPLSGATAVSFVSSSTDDDISSAIPIGFSFNFAGTNYSNVYVSTNGFVSFNASAVNAPSNSLMSSSTTVRPLIAPLWDDMDLASGGASYKLEGTSPNRVFTVEWNNVRWNWQATGAVVSFQAKLYESTNNVEFLYRSDATAYNAGSTGGASVGLAGVSTGSGNFISLNNIGTAPTASMTTETNNISSKPTTGQSYLFRAPIASSVWSPTTGLFTNRAMTTAYTGTSVNKVYARPSATQKYYLTATNGACSLRDSIVDSIKNANSLITLASASTTGAVEQCADASGWTYYASAAKPDEWLFGIHKNGNTFTATVDINVDNTNKYQKSTLSNGANQEHASYIMSRYWNANITSGSIASNSSVKVRFFIDTQDITDLLDERDDDYDVLKNTTNPSTFAVKSGFEWFKTVTSTYSPTNWNGNTHSGTIVKLTEDAVGTLNGQTYVELSGITSFSGGTGGAAFGPTSNGLFNNGGVVGLPVTWNQVDVHVLEQGNELHWSTSSEQNTSHFEVEYSDDAVQFYKVSENIPAAGNSSTTQYYKFLHESEMKPWLYYRVKQVDLDGKVDYSKIVIAKRASKLPDFKVLIYPIPLIEGDLTLDIHSIAQTELQIRIIDLLGKEVHREKVPSKGYRTQHQLQLDHLPKGQYQIQIDNSVFNHQQRLVLLK